MNTTMLLFVLVILASGFGENFQQDIEFEETERVVGGKTAAEGKYPWVVAFYFQDSYICTASIISETAILTAAHCVVFQGETQSPNDFFGVAGVVDRTSPDGLHIEFKSITVHPSYNENGLLDNDIAILETKSPIKFNKNIQKICIANDRIGKMKAKRVVAMGWGQVNRNLSDPQVPAQLKYVNQQVVANLKCRALFFFNPVPEAIICASGIFSGICSGDSGSPLVYYAQKKPVQVGVASFVNGVTGCGRLLGPAAFARVSSFTQYIKSTATGTVCVA